MAGESVQTPAQQLEAILTRTDRLSVDGEGDLLIEDVKGTGLLQRFGSPLYVFSEATLRENYRRIRRAFTDVWPGPVNIMYAIKANTNLALRTILHQEGAGGDCFSEGELYATFKAGADPQKIALNGGYKTVECLRIAIERGITINLDAEDEIEKTRTLCQSIGKPVNVNIRLKPLSDAFNQNRTDYFGGDRLAEHVRRTKWGFSTEAASKLIERIQLIPELRLTGLSVHIGRASRELAFYRHYGQAVGRMAADLHRETGFAPQVLDIGGGWARERDPESGSLDLNPTPVEELVRVTCSEILTHFGTASMPVPALWVEPGRFIVGNASVLLSTVGIIKKDIGLTWVTIDASTNDLPRIDTSGSAYHVVAASGMHRPADHEVDVVGPICIDSSIGKTVQMPALCPGEPVAILDAGMYSESASTQFNSIPRPATVLVSESTVDVIREREKINDIFRLHRIPRRLQSDQE